MASQYYKRGWLIFDECPSHPALSAPVELAPGMWAARKWPTSGFDLPTHWREWIGDIRSGHLKQPKLVVWTDRTTGSRAIDLINEKLGSDLHLVYNSLGFALRRGKVHAYVLVELLGGESREIQDFDDTLQEIRAEAINDRFSIDIDRWSAVLQILPGLISTKALSLAAEHSFWSFLKGCRATEADERLEQFVRSMEVLFQTRQGGGAEQFARALCMYRQKLDTDGRLRTYKRLYERRNGIVHGQLFLAEEKDDRAVRLSEALARDLITHFITNKDFRDRLSEHHEAERIYREADRVERARRRARR